MKILWIFMAVVLGGIIVWLVVGTSYHNINNNTNLNIKSPLATNAPTAVPRINNNKSNVSNANQGVTETQAVNIKKINSNTSDDNSITNTNATVNASITNSTTADKAANTVVNKTYNIYVTSSGFQPSTITIVTGDKVVWTNDDSSAHYVAPNVHPTHTQYAGVWPDDGTGYISSGESYSFVFNKPGTYNYHDHLNASLTGTVIVK